LPFCGLTAPEGIDGEDSMAIVPFAEVRWFMEQELASSGTGSHGSRSLGASSDRPGADRCSGRRAAHRHHDGPGDCHDRANRPGWNADHHFLGAMVRTCEARSLSNWTPNTAARRFTLAVAAQRILWLS